MSPSSPRHAIVTGTASGLGKALVVRLRNDGWRVAGFDRSDATGDATYGVHGVRACSVSPGYMRTGMTARVLSREDILAGIEASVPLGRVSDPAEVAHMIAFLLGSEAGFLTGQDITVDGGGGLMAYVGNTEVADMWSRLARRPTRHNG